MSSKKTMYRIGIDVGGTFTDGVSVGSDGAFMTFKSSSTPEDSSGGVMAVLGQMANWAELTLEGFLDRCVYIVHGTTVGTNTVLQRKGVQVGLITTKGFRDLLQTWWKPHHRYDIRYPMLAPLVPRRLRFEIEERITSDGRELDPLKESDVVTAVHQLKTARVDAIAISFLFSFLAPEHEEEAAAIVRSEWPEVPVYASSRILPQVGDFQRTTDTILAAYTGPLVGPYLRNLQRRLIERGFGGRLLIMQANGGVVPVEAACENSLGTINSGPAGGPPAAIWCARNERVKDVLLTDMGGTSFDCTLIRNLEIPTTRESEVDGYPLAFPAVDVETIGAGGGSIAWVDPGGRARVGPHSAGAVPGPACYGLGGTQPTVTDANVVLGYLDPEYFLGGARQLNAGAAEKAVAEYFADPLGLETVAAAYAIYTIVNHHMADAIGSISIKRGQDPRECILVVGGGAGATHAARLAQQLGITKILIPSMAPTFCAYGMLITDVRYDFVLTHFAKLSSADLDRLLDAYRDMESRGLQRLAADGYRRADVSITWSADMHYEGQVHEVEVWFDRQNGAFTKDDVARIEQAFHRRHETLYDYRDESSEVELVNVRVAVSAPGAAAQPKAATTNGASPTKPKARHMRRVYLPEAEDFVEIPAFYPGELNPHDVLTGPAVVHEAATTVLVPPGCSLEESALGDYLVTVEPAP